MRGWNVFLCLYVCDVCWVEERTRDRRWTLCPQSPALPLLRPLSLLHLICSASQVLLTFTSSLFSRSLADDIPYLDFRRWSTWAKLDVESDTLHYPPVLVRVLSRSMVSVCRRKRMGEFLQVKPRWSAIWPDVSWRKVDVHNWLYISKYPLLGMSLFYKLLTEK